MTDEQKQDFTLRISQANETQLVVILYEILAVYLQEAEDALENGNQGFEEAVRKSRSCINELIASLDLRYSPGVELKKIYFFWLRQLAQGLRKKEKAPFKQVQKGLVKLHKAYSEVASQNTNGPVMSNSQTVYTGMVYGRDSLSHSLTDAGSGRGLWV